MRRRRLGSTFLHAQTIRISGRRENNQCQAKRMNPMTPPIEEEQEIARELDSSCNHHQQSINASSHEESSSSSSSRGNKHALCVVEIGAGSSSRPPNEFTRDATGRSDRSRFANWLTNTIPLPHCCCRFFGVQPFGPRTRLYQVWQGKNVSSLLTVLPM